MHFDLLMGAVNLRNIRDALARLPPQLADTYGEMMKRINDQDEQKAEIAFKTIAWIAFAKRPLKVKEIQHALAVRPGDKSFDSSGITDEDLIIQCCGGFVGRQQNQTLGFVHYTTHKHIIAWSKYRDEDIAQTCLTYLSFEILGQDDLMCPSHKIDLRSDGHALLDYASKHWGHHARGDPEIKLKELALRFCRLRQNALTSIGLILLERYPEKNLPYYPILSTLLRGYSPIIQRFYGLWITAHFGLRSLVSALLESTTFNIRNFDTTKGSLDLDNYEDYPLFEAAKAGFYDVVTLLIERGADLDAGNRPELRIIDLAMKEKKDDLLILCLKRFDETSKVYPLPFVVKYGNIDDVKLLLKHESDTEARDVNGCTALLLAAKSAQLDVISLLLGHGADIEASDVDGRTALLHAAGLAQPDVLSLLLGHGADIEASDVYGRTALLYAAGLAQPDVLSLLLGHGADASAADLSKITGLHLSSSGTNTRMLIGKGADVSARTYSGTTPLHLACCEDMARALIGNGADVDARCDLGEVALHHAATINDPSSIRCLLEHDAYIDASDSAGGTALFAAASAGSLESLNTLLAAGASVDKCGADGMAALTPGTAKWAFADRRCPGDPRSGRQRTNNEHWATCWTAYFLPRQRYIDSVCCRRRKVVADARYTKWQNTSALCCGSWGPCDGPKIVRRRSRFHM